MRYKIIFFAFACLGWSVYSAAQDIDLDKLLDQEIEKKNKDKTEYTEATFKTTRLINGHSVESTQPGVLDLKISHRFNPLNGGPYEFFGLDGASMRIGFDYGISDRLSIGIGRSTFEKQFDGFAKYRLLRQSTGKVNMPLSVTWVSTVMLKTKKEAVDSIKRNFSDNVSFAHQLIIARKFNDEISLQLMPTMVHYNIVPLNTIPNDLFSMGIGGRVKITKRVSINAEYYYQLPGYTLPGTHNSLSLGVDIETGGHVFQLHFTNSTGMTERTFINETTGQWKLGDEGGIRFGFNIARVFTIKKPKPINL